MRIPAYDMISRISRMNGRMPFLPPSSSTTAPDSVTSEPDNLLAATSPAAPARDVIAAGPTHAHTHAEPSRAEPSTALDLAPYENRTPVAERSNRTSVRTVSARSNLASMYLHAQFHAVGAVLW